jgi:hypothetical protein
MADTEKGTTPIGDDKEMSLHKEHVGVIAHDAAERGHLATDEHGRPLVEFDKAAESRLRLKIDLYIVPTVAVMYLFCFIDRANIGVYTNSRYSSQIAMSSFCSKRLICFLLR